MAEWTIGLLNADRRTDPTRNWTRNLQSCGTVPQPTAPLLVPCIISKFWVNCKFFPSEIVLLCVHTTGCLLSLIYFYVNVKETLRLFHQQWTPALDGGESLASCCRDFSFSWRVQCERGSSSSRLNVVMKSTIPSLSTLNPWSKANVYWLMYPSLPSLKKCNNHYAIMSIPCKKQKSLWALSVSKYNIL